MSNAVVVLADLHRRLCCVMHKVSFLGGAGGLKRVRVIVWCFLGMPVWGPPICGLPHIPQNAGFFDLFPHGSGGIMRLMYYCFHIGHDDIPVVLFCCRCTKKGVLRYPRCNSMLFLTRYFSSSPPVGMRNRTVCWGRSSMSPMK